MTARVRLGLRANAAQFSLLVGLNALVGGMVGLERSVLPLVGKQDFGLRSTAAILAFVVAFGAAKALSNLASGELAERIGRKRLLVIGWTLALPVAPLIAFAPSWWVVVFANVLLGANQGLAWSMTVVMKIDLVGPRRRGLALGLNEAAGYLGVAAMAFATGALAAGYAPRTVVWVGAAVISLLGLLLRVFAVRDTSAHVALEQEEHGDRSGRPIGLGDVFVMLFFGFVAVRAGTQVLDVRRMVILGFQNRLVAVFYIFAVGLLSLHLLHGAESLFQTLGWRNGSWFSRQRIPGCRRPSGRSASRAPATTCSASKCSRRMATVP